MTAAGFEFRDIFTTLGRLARERRDAPALVSPRGRVTTFGGLEEAVGAAATRLQAAGLHPGDAVVFSVRPSVEAIVLILATARAGGVLVAADPGMGESLFNRRMAAVQPRFVMAESLLYALSASRLARRVLRSRKLELPRVGRLPGCRFVRVGRRLPGTPPSLDAARLMAPLPGPARPLVARPPHAPVLIVFTSGTTAEPRAVVHSARSVAASVRAAHHVSDLGERSVVLTDQLHSALPALLAGSRVQLPPIGADPAGILRLLYSARATHAFAVPSDLQRLVVYCEQRSLRLPRSLRQLVLGSAPAGRMLLARLQPLLADGTRVVSLYGLTEMAPVARVDMEEKLAWEDEGDLVGRLLPGADARVAGDGELFVFGERLCERYLESRGEGKGGEPLAEVATGDLARMDGSGRLVLLGRKKEMIIRNGFNIYPALYEERIAALPGVARCAMISAWDEAHGDERVVLVLESAVKGADPARLRRRVERALRTEAIIDSMALPDEIVVMPLPEAGRTHKLDRDALRRAITRRPPV
jgi:acyl-CoA synthetase (AMP-forming)/AMP-acid ligase II